MDAYFPAPLPDESLYSLLARYRASISYSDRHISRSEFGYEDALSSPSSLGENAHFFYERHSEFWKNERAFLRAMTSCNFFSPFLTKSMQGRFYKALQGYTGGVPSLLRAHLYFPNNNFVSLKYCPECVVKDINKYGVAYWHRSHCVWCVAVCWQHGNWLKEVQRENRFELPPQDQVYSEVVLANSADISVAKLTNELLKGGLPWDISISNIRACYLKVLNTRNSKLKAYSRDIQSRIEGTYSPEFLQALKVRRNFNGAGTRQWFYDVIKGQSLEHIPEHLLVISQLFSSIRELRTVLTTLDSAP